MQILEQIRDFDEEKVAKWFIFIQQQNHKSHIF